MRPPRLTIRSAKTVMVEACLAIWLVAVPFIRAEVHLVMACWDSTSPIRQGTHPRYRFFLSPVAAPSEVKGGLLMTRPAFCVAE